MVGTEKPEDRDGGGEALAEAVASLDGDAAVVTHGVEDLLLLVPELNAEGLMGKADGADTQGTVEVGFHGGGAAVRPIHVRPIYVRPIGCGG